MGGAIGGAHLLSCRGAVSFTLDLWPSLRALNFCCWLPHAGQMDTDDPSAPVRI